MGAFASKNVNFELCLLSQKKHGSSYIIYFEVSNFSLFNTASKVKPWNKLWYETQHSFEMIQSFQIEECYKNR